MSSETRSLKNASRCVPKKTSKICFKSVPLRLLTSRSPTIRPIHPTIRRSVRFLLPHFFFMSTFDSHRHLSWFLKLFWQLTFRCWLTGGWQDMLPLKVESQKTCWSRYCKLFSSPLFRSTNSYSCFKNFEVHFTEGLFLWADFNVAYPKRSCL